MNLNRRNFMKTMGVLGVTALAGDKLRANPVKEKEIEFSGVLYDSTRCVGCQTCEGACAKANGLPEPNNELTPDKHRTTDEKQRTVINYYKIKDKDVFVKKQCMHCNEPACAAACLTQAMYKTNEGPVIWRADKCMGCRYCMVSCPFDIPKFEYHSANPKIEKCTMCSERLKEGKVPACVENCPAEALKFGTRRELIKEARKRIAEKPNEYVDYIFGEHEAGGTGFIYLTSVPANQLGFNISMEKSSYPALSKGFLYAVPSVFVLVPSILLGIYEATKNNKTEEEEK